LVPAELGGGGAGYTEICHSLRRIAMSCGATTLAFSMHAHLVAAAAWRWRNQNAPTDGLLKRVVSEDLIIVSSGGSDWLKSAGTAVRTEVRISDQRAQDLLQRRSGRRSAGDERGL
jgi:acyl-CoA dehydrogenase